MVDHFGAGPEDFLQGDSEGDSAIGQFLFDPSINFWGVLGVDQNGQFFLTDPNTGSTRPTQSREFLTSLLGQADQVFKLDGAGNILRQVSAKGFLPSSGSGVSRALSLQEQQQLLELQQKFELTQAEQQQKFELEQIAKQQVFTTGEREESQLFQAAESSKARENQQRLALQSEINNLIGQAVGIRQRSRELLAQTLGQDPFRSGALLRGQVGRGTTPTEAFRTRLHQTSGFEAPEVDFGAPISTLQGQAQDIRDFVTTGLPDQPAFGGPGLARGGVVDMKKGQDGKFGVRKFGEVGQSILVGERGPEVVTFSKGKATVTPLIGAAAHGGSFSTSDLDPSPSSFTTALSPILTGAGFQDAPVFSRDRSGFLNPAQRQMPLGITGLADIGRFFGERPADFGATALQRLGVSPRVVRNSATGAIFFKGDDGQFRHIPNMAAFRRFGFRPDEVVSLSPESFQSLGIQSAGTLTEPRGLEESTSFGPFPRPALAPIGENQFVGLPDPASFIRTFGRLDRASQLGILSAFGTAGVGLEDFFERQDFFTPSGSAQAGVTAGLR